MQFTQGLHRAVQQHPEAIATVCGDRRQSFGQLRERVGKLAGGLAAQGLGPGDRIAILALNSDRYLEAYLAIAWLGAVVNPINFRWSAEEVTYSLNDSNSTAILLDDQFAAMASDIREKSPSVAHYFFQGDGDLPEGMVSTEAMIADSAAIDDAEASGDTLFGIFYTGGTTGRPKGVMLSHANLFSSGLALLSEGLLAEGAKGLHAAPMFHLADMMLTTCLVIRGGQHHFLPAFRPDSLLQMVASESITDLLLVPAMLQAIVGFEGAKQFDTTSVKSIMYGASPAAETLLDGVMNLFTSASLTQVYGMTETAAVMTVLPAATHLPENRQLGRLRSGGRSACHVQVRIVDDQDRERPRGEVGEIIARGPNLMQGYLNKPEASEEALKGGWMHTGDVGYMDDNGYVFIVDRKKDMIISGGENVYCAEVENAVLKHPAVAACAVIGIPCDDMGEKVHAAVVVKPDHTLELDELYAHCKQLVAGYKCPRSMNILDALPLSGAGKVLKTELRKPYWQDKERMVS
ncbi:long-chain-fatty-acid--CoA ligase [Spongiibacter nanhainus]|uniref:Long-chain-fatty-acid--CoA ligase n=1 Tax=Spongiibacter nanhainus TaxID=2794344 RepID=A0A7T4UQX8_9GAMM|nr:long-chain-fatty-acid--CoA ligase [Spongiibacter nanhainus]QQD19146.1 long-chain-fatty-acid--CoA ligase [Spongiibacter nanhainus]